MPGGGPPLSGLETFFGSVLLASYPGVTTFAFGHAVRFIRLRVESAGTRHLYYCLATALYLVASSPILFLYEFLHLTSPYFYLGLVTPVALFAGVTTPKERTRRITVVAGLTWLMVFSLFFGEYLWLRHEEKQKSRARRQESDLHLAEMQALMDKRFASPRINPAIPFETGPLFLDVDDRPYRLPLPVGYHAYAIRHPYDPRSEEGWKYILTLDNPDTGDSFSLDLDSYFGKLQSYPWDKDGDAHIGIKHMAHQFLARQDAFPQRQELRNRFARFFPDIRFLAEPYHVDARSRPANHFRVLFDQAYTVEQFTGGLFIAKGTANLRYARNQRQASTSLTLLFGELALGNKSVRYMVAREGRDTGEKDSAITLLNAMVDANLYIDEEESDPDIAALLDAPALPVPEESPRALHVSTTQPLVAAHSPRLAFPVPEGFDVRTTPIVGGGMWTIVEMTNTAGEAMTVVLHPSTSPGWDPDRLAARKRIFLSESMLRWEALTSPIRFAKWGKTLRGPRAFAVVRDDDVAGMVAGTFSLERTGSGEVHRAAIVSGTMIMGKDLWGVQAYACSSAADMNVGFLLNWLEELRLTN